MSAPPFPIFLTGPTAVGKSDLAMQLAGETSGEIISADSMQVYRGLDVGTAKPSPQNRSRIPHHLIDVAELCQTFDAGQFVKKSTQAVRKIKQRQKIPIFCGGTGFYLKAYREGLDDLPPRNPALRIELEQTPPEKLLEELCQKDPLLFAQIDSKNLRRVIRALEIIRQTQQPASAQRRQWAAKTTLPPLIVLFRPAANLRKRIYQRVEAMFQAGLIEETKALLKCGIQENPVASRALGYRQVLYHLENQNSLSETIALVKTKTWQFARRQLTWFRKQKHTIWLDLDTILPKNLSGTVQNALAQFNTLRTETTPVQQKEPTTIQPTRFDEAGFSPADYR